MIDHQTIDRIMDAANIVDVVSEFVTLRKSGMNYKGLCPFHDDRTPSFSVSPSKGIYKCFSCGKAGNAANFIMEHEQMSYPDALKWLARNYHIEVEERELTELWLSLFDKGVGEGIEPREILLKKREEKLSALMEEEE